MGSDVDAIRAAEVVIPAVPYGATASIVDEAGEALDDKILVDVTNRFGDEEPGAVVDGSSNAEQIAWMAPDGRVVKAFNTVLASRQADPQVNDMLVDNFVASTDADAKATVSRAHPLDRHASDRRRSALIGSIPRSEWVP